MSFTRSRGDWSSWTGPQSAHRGQERPGPVALWRPGQPEDLSGVADLGTNNLALAVAPRRGSWRRPARASSIWSEGSTGLVTNLTANASRLEFSKDAKSLASFDQASSLFTVWTRRVDEAFLAQRDQPGLRCTLSPDAVCSSLLCENPIPMVGYCGGLSGCGHSGPPPGVTSVDFSPDGKELASGSRTGPLLSGTPNPRQIARWKADLLSVPSVAFSPDGTRLATGLSDGRATRLWDLNPRLWDATSPTRVAHPYALQGSISGGSILA